MDATLQQLLSDAIGAVDGHTAAFRDGDLDADGWQRRMARTLIEHHTAAYLAGKEPDDRVLRAADKAILADVLGAQLDYLNAFADTLAATEDDGWKATYEARARLYAGAITGSFWRGRTVGIDLPAYPGDGSTPCLGRCGCAIRIERDDNEVRVYWQLGPKDSCDGCVERAGIWSPYIITVEGEDDE